MSIIEGDIKEIAQGILPEARALEGSTLLITGGAGFLGKYFIGAIDYLNRRHLRRACTVISVDNFITGMDYWLSPGPHFKTLRHDVKEPLKIDGDVDYIIHAAGIASPKFYRIYKLETIEVATLGTWNMLKLARERKVKSMLSFSSSEVYGNPDPRFIPTPETYFGNVSSVGPRANYDESKRLGETLCRTYFESFGTPVKMVRPFNVYGPGMRADDYRVIPNFVACGLAGNPLPVYGDGSNTRTFCYITDAITGFFKVLLSGMDGEVFNVGNDKPEISVSNLAGMISALLSGARVENTRGLNDAYANSDPRRRCPDLTKIQTSLGYNPHVQLETGLLRFIQWARQEQSFLKTAQEAPVLEKR